jgi:hypothetical protein
MSKTTVFTSVAALACVLAVQTALAQRAGEAGAAVTAQQAAPFDLTGYWVSIVTEDWRWRMLTPPKGDYASVPLNAAGLKVANLWTPAEDGSCKAYGMAGLMRMPTDLHISWMTPNTLRIETDWGEQTRMLYFDRADLPQRGPSLQGNSFATWERPVPLAIGAAPRGPGGVDLDGNPIIPRNGAGARRGARAGAGTVERGPEGPGDLKVTTDQLTPAWLRRNGVPYGSGTSVMEYYKTFDDPMGREWFDVFTIVNDPEYLSAPFVTSSDYRRLPDASSWSPHPCRSDL